MKKLISSLLVISMAFSSIVAKADNLTIEQAKAAAAYYLACNSGQEGLSAGDMVLVHQIDNLDLGVPAAYFFNAPKCGWVVIAATTTIDPVIAFSEEGALDMSALPANMLWWVNGYVEMVKEIQLLDAENDYPDSEEWEAIVNGKLPSPKEDVRLMDEYWGQGSTTNPTYNLYCPKVGNRTSVTGCVATALAQMCHYYRYPVKPDSRVRVYSWNGSILSLNYDTISFDYDLMPYAINARSTDAQIRETAKLNYAIGVGVRMDYHPDGSGANSETAMQFMNLFFKYTQGLYIARGGSGDTAYLGRIRRELEKKNILYMAGASETGDQTHAAGHAWLCCGYRTESSKMYYMNWGWDGDGNGWYNLGDNNMPISGSGYNFNVGQRVIIGMTPPDDSNRFFVGIREVDNTILNSAYPNPASVSVTIPYSLDNSADLCIYSIDGRLVETRRLQAGSGEAVVRVNNMPAGIYVYRLNSAAGKFIVK